MTSRTIILAIILAIVAGSIIYLESTKTERAQFADNSSDIPVPAQFLASTTSGQTQISEASGETSVAQRLLPTTTDRIKAKAAKYERIKEITTPDGFINLPVGQTDLKLADIVGKKVILVDFWTYSCINCQRTTPYLNAWYEKYGSTSLTTSSPGLVIVGVHTPEFEFEKVYQNVLDATKRLGIKYPVVLDNDYSTWTAYKNRYWPRKYLVDIDGYIVYDHIGEGQYEETEQKIQELLTERMAVLGESGAISQAITKETQVGIEGGARSPETYFGAARNQFFGNGSGGALGDQKNLVIQSKLNLHTLYLAGDWNIANEFAENISTNAAIVYRYTAKDVFLVSEADREIIVEVLRDGKPIGGEAGADVIKTSDGKTIVKIKEARLYKIIQGDQSETHTLQFIIPSPGLRAFTFTFG